MTEYTANELIAQFLDNDVISALSSMMPLVGVGIILTSMMFAIASVVIVIKRTALAGG